MLHLPGPMAFVSGYILIGGHGTKKLVGACSVWLRSPLARISGAFLTLLCVTRGAEIPTFTRDIAPIVFENCAPCHRPGESGPFSLLNYSDVKSHARQIVAVTSSRFMPPWLPEKSDYPFAEERRLSGKQIALIRAWVAAGEKEGDPKQLPPLPKFVPGWQLGKPDMILRAAKPYHLPAAGTDTYWNFVLPVPVNRTHWMDAFEIRPGNKRVVHHANIIVDRSGHAREMEATPGAGFGGMDLRIESETFDPDSHLLFWKPGTVPAREPKGMALRIDKGTDLVLNVHLQPSGKAEDIQPTIGLYFTDQPATLHPMLLEIENDAALKIPAGQAHFPVADTFTLPVGVDLMAVYPHAHYLGKDIAAIATFPSGTTKTLIHISHWDVNWQAVYRYAHPVFLPKGTKVTMRYSYDNSASNPFNPNRPPKLVEGGNRAVDEMAHLWLQVLPHPERPLTEDPRMILQEALSRHEVEKDPTNFEAQYNLAAMLAARNKLPEAAQHYAAAERIRPHDAVVNNALGSMLLADGNVDEAIPHLQDAVKTRPTYFDAHYNLALALASKNEFAGAAEQFRLALQIHPNDGNAHANFGSALAQLGQLTEAKTQFETALRINPGNKLARENLALLEQMLAGR